MGMFGLKTLASGQKKNHTQYRDFESLEHTITVENHMFGCPKSLQRLVFLATFLDKVQQKIY